MSTFTLSDAKNEAGEWIMSPEQIRAEMSYERDPYDAYDAYDRDEPDADPETCKHEYGQDNITVWVDDDNVPEWSAMCADCGWDIRADVIYGPRTENDHHWNAGMYGGEREYGGATDYALTWTLSE